MSESGHLAIIYSNGVEFYVIHITVAHFVTVIYNIYVNRYRIIKIIIENFIKIYILYNNF